jgi:hypothetical protein
LREEEECLIEKCRHRRISCRAKFGELTFIVDGFAACKIQTDFVPPGAKNASLRLN